MRMDGVDGVASVLEDSYSLYILFQFGKYWLVAVTTVIITTVGIHLTL